MSEQETDPDLGSSDRCDNCEAGESQLLVKGNRNMGRFCPNCLEEISRFIILDGKNPKPEAKAEAEP